MSRKPTNFTLLDTNKVPWGTMTPVTVADSFEGQTSNLNDDGLYSTSIFGRVGTDERDKTISYIDVTLPIFNPTYFKALIQLKALYGEIIRGRAYAVWDAAEKDFIKSNILEGDTGYAFFMSHFHELDPVQNESFKRKQKIDLVEQFRDRALSNKVIVIPAGIRDIEMNNGVVSENEINDLYRKLIFRSKSLNVRNVDIDDPVYDNIRWGLQESFNNIADFLFKMQEGKRGFMQRRMSRRSIFGATRNVITSRKVSVENCDDNVTGDPNSTIIGLYQALLGFNLVAIHELSSGFLSEVFTSGMGVARLVDPKTLKGTYVDVSPVVVDKFTSSDGLTSLFNGYGSPNLRNRDIRVAGHYLGLVYDDGKNVMLLHDIDDLPESFDKKKVRPVTYTQFFYMQCVKAIEKKMLQVTRYPITGIGSIYPSRVFVMPTNSTSSKRTLLDIDGSPIDTYNYFPEWTKNPSYFDGMSIANIRLGLAGGDFDGDALSANSIMAEDSIAEIESLFGKRDFYISGSGDFLYDPVQEPHEFLLRSLTNGLA
ncbi:putative virion-associated RNA polymerase beta' subunit [Klebsiella phage N1M2]|uniref:Putative virion-associated RNA polymerase beta' subunit n=1 Tax=Klebsiella phage N1M2 TaxID=2664939 RepID=A0A6B7ZF77_9CAUD|nr:putative virion-associated RNA polymerase beta' subunit [Klebsiella phage N1M2]QGH72085.1 putative virion-associated RNA polymerase beta' subunit [Klebsiella phage N1M2]